MPEQTIRYTYEVPKDDWRSWKLTVPRDISLRERLDTLREYDRDHDLDALVASGSGLTADDVADALEAADAADVDEVRLTAMRLRRRCMTALPDAREHGADRAADELSEMQDLADELLEFDPE